MHRKWIATIGIIVALASLAVAGTGYARYGDQEVAGGSITLDKQAESAFPSLAGITLDKAVKAALDRTPGAVLGAQLEEENGFLVYGVEIVPTGGTDVVKLSVDAGTGKVLAMENDHPDGHDEHGDNEDRDEHDDDR